MKTWIFNSNNKTIGPLDGEEAIKFVENNPTAYAWQPSYTHWMPVNCIEEFTQTIDFPTPPPVVPQELMDAFYSKEKALIDKLSTIEARITLTNQSMLEFGREVSHYKKLTRDCNIEMQETLESIEKQYAKLKANLRNAGEMAISDKAEFESTVTEFNSTIAVKKTPLNSTNDEVEVTKSTVVESAEDSLIPEPVVEQLSAENDDELEVVTQILPEASATVVEATIEAEGEATVDVIEETVNEIAVNSDIVAPTQRVARQPEPVVSQIASKVTASLSSLVNDAPEVKRSSISSVEYSEDISPEDRYVSSKMQQFQANAEEMTTSLESHSNSDDFAGDFDYILKDKYDTGNSVAELAEDALSDIDEDNPKKRRRRRRR